MKPYKNHQGGKKKKSLDYETALYDQTRGNGGTGQNSPFNRKNLTSRLNTSKLKISVSVCSVFGASCWSVRKQCLCLTNNCNRRGEKNDTSANIQDGFQAASNVIDSYYHHFRNQFGNLSTSVCNKSKVNLCSHSCAFEPKQNNRQDRKGCSLRLVVGRHGRSSLGPRDFTLESDQ